MRFPQRDSWLGTVSQCASTQAEAAIAISASLHRQTLADFPLLIVVSERKIASEWPTICPEPWSSFPRTPFLANPRVAASF